MGKKFDSTEYLIHCAKRDEENQSKIRYYIDEEKQTIVAVMDDCAYDAIDVLAKMGICSITHDNYNLNKFMMNPTYRGKAKCAPEDEWDEEEGMRIARNRMLENYYRGRATAMMRAETALQSILEELGSRIDYTDNRYEKAFHYEL